MPFSVAGPTVSAFPQTGLGKTRAEALEYIASFVGGENEPDAKRKAGRALDAAVDRYNMVDWKFKRKTQNLTLATGLAGKEYPLDSLFKSPFRARLLDTNGREQDEVTWLPFEEFKDRFPFQGQVTGNQPLIYTAMNVHNTGKVIIYPELAGPLTWPTMQITYHEWIAKTAADGDRLNVPSSVEAAMLEYAVGKAMAMEEGMQASARTQLVAAEDLYYRVEIDPTHGRSFPDA